MGENHMPNKEVFLPTLEELQELEQLLKDYQNEQLGNGYNNSYQYLKAKTIEKMIITSNGEDILRKNEQYIVDPNIAISIAKMYPKEVASFPVLAKNSDIFATILEEGRIPSSHPLDNLAYFDPSIANSTDMKKNILHQLNEELKRNPMYRFTYQSSFILDSIFNGQYWEQLKKANNIYSSNDRVYLYELLTAIDPTYIMKTNLEEFKLWRGKGEYHLDDSTCASLLEHDRRRLIASTVKDYCRRYYLPSVWPMRDIEKTIDDLPEAKKLIKYLNIK